MRLAPFSHFWPAGRRCRAPRPVAPGSLPASCDASAPGCRRAGRWGSERSFAAMVSEPPWLPLAKAIEQKSSRLLELSLVVSVCHVSIFGRNVCLPKFLEITRRASTRPKSEKPRKSRERNGTKRLKRQQQERKEKYRERQCRANKEQRRQLSKLSATHDVQPRQRREISRWGLPHCPEPHATERCDRNCVAN